MQPQGQEEEKNTIREEEGAQQVQVQKHRFGGETICVLPRMAASAPAELRSSY